MTFKGLHYIQDPCPKLKNSDIPILVIQAQYDNQKWGFTKEYGEIFKNDKLHVIPNSGHAISIEMPGFYVKSIEEFLK